MVLLMRFTGIRISDVVTLSREHIQGGYLVKRAVKNGSRLRIKLEPVVMQALHNLPRPMAATADSPMYFAGQGKMPSLRKGAERLLARAFKLAGIENGYPHRFRHTFASELLAKGTNIEVVADLLGDSVAIVRKHYWKWIEEWQMKKDAATRLLSDEPQNAGTKLAHADKANFRTQ
jgi:integrase